MSISELTCQLESEIRDADEETFVLYSQAIPSQNLGFVDRQAAVVDITVGDRDFTLHQSPGVLASNRAGGTTGAVLWKVTPLFAEWISSPGNILFAAGSLRPDAVVLELGCGICPLIGLALGPRLARYVLSDQRYVQRLVQQNIDENEVVDKHGGSHSRRRNRGKPLPHGNSSSSGSGSSSNSGNVTFTTLDWETDQVSPALTGLPDVQSFDAVIACDCVFNYALVRPFVQACVDVCKLRQSEDADSIQAGRPCLCIVAQQLRNDDVFNSWLSTFHQQFRVWRVPDGALPEKLRSDAGFVVHVGILRSNPTASS